MTVSVMTVKLHAPWVHSLKEKRMIVRSLCEKLANRFNVSVIESDAQDFQTDNSIFNCISFCGTLMCLIATRLSSRATTPE